MANLKKILTNPLLLIIGLFALYIVVSSKYSLITDWFSLQPSELLDSNEEDSNSEMESEAMDTFGVPGLIVKVEYIDRTIVRDPVTVVLRYGETNELLLERKTQTSGVARFEQNLLPVDNEATIEVNIPKTNSGVGITPLTLREFNGSPQTKTIFLSCVDVQEIGISPGEMNCDTEEDTSSKYRSIDKTDNIWDVEVVKGLPPENACKTMSLSYTAIVANGKAGEDIRGKATLTCTPAREYYARGDFQDSDSCRGKLTINKEPENQYLLLWDYHPENCKRGDISDASAWVSSS